MSDLRPGTITPSERERTAKVVFATVTGAGTLRCMETILRIREASPCELFAERLEREAQLASSDSPEQAADYRRQAQMLREMAATPLEVAGALSAVRVMSH